MKVLAFVGDDSVKRRLAVEAAAPSGAQRFDLANAEDRQRAVESLGLEGFGAAPRVMVWDHAEELKQLQGSKLNELTLNRFEFDDDLTVLLDIHEKGSKKANPSMNQFLGLFPDSRDVESKFFLLPAPWLENEQIPWITDLAKSYGLNLGNQLAKQLKQMVGFDAERLHCEIRALAELKKQDPKLTVSSSLLQRWIHADHADLEAIVDAVLFRRKEEARRLSIQLDRAAMTWPEIVLKLQTASWNALQFIGSVGQSKTHTAKMLRTSEGKVFAMGKKFAGVSLDRASALHQMAMALSANVTDETADLMRPGLRLAGELSRLS